LPYYWVTHRTFDPPLAQWNDMPLYTFELRDGTDLLEDEIGVSLPDRDDALEYARGVARELMTGREVRARTWQLNVYENRSHRVFEIPFVALDATLNHLNADLRSTIETVCRRQLALREAVSAVQITLRESRALVARSRGKPYLATCFGERTIRDT
jgi:hypothetical protein